jgi:GNAT superfamily N-acetyltransferase
MVGPVPPGWQAHVGARVVLRVTARNGRHRDVLGDLVAADDATLRVLTRRGEVVVAVADVVAGKPVPPAPVRKAPPHLALSTLALETVMAGHWRAPRTHNLGGWLLRAADGFTNRANSVLPLGDPGLPPADAVAAVARWYAGQELPARAAAPAPRPDDPDRDVLDDAAAAFSAAGWAPLAGAGADVLVAPTAALLDPAPAVGVGGGEISEPPAGLRVALLDEPDSGWLDRYHYRGQPLQPAGVTLLRSAPRQVFAAVRDGSATVAVARGSLAHAWAGVTAVEVAPEHRRQGLARLLLAVVAEWAWRGGAGSTFVQTGETNGAALQLYLGAGFTRHHTYAYLAPSGEG